MIMSLCRIQDGYPKWCLERATWRLLLNIAGVTQMVCLWKGTFVGWSLVVDEDERPWNPSLVEFHHPVLKNIASQKDHFSMWKIQKSLNHHLDLDLGHQFPTKNTHLFVEKGGWGCRISLDTPKMTYILPYSTIMCSTWENLHFYIPNISPQTAQNHLCAHIDNDFWPSTPPPK